VTGFDSEGDLVCSAAMPVGATSPSISINSPADGKERPSGAAIPFIANASDPEDGTLSGASIVWVDDVDGQIGTGASFSYSYSGSSLGQHQVTATATESDGNTAGATITIT